MEPVITAIVLAAGTSGRMGRPKPLLPFGDAPMIARVIESLKRARVADIYVVTGHESAAVVAAVTGYRVSTIHNPDYAKGEMLSSLRAGFVALDIYVDSFLVVLGDQPAVKSETIRDIVSRGRRETPLVIPTYGGKRGHPVLISTELIEEIEALPPSGTLRDVVHRHLDKAVLVEVDDPAIVADVDTPEDYQRALGEWLKCEGENRLAE
jgi:molybdenum cofactor cytidylyltransferase